MIAQAILSALGAPTVAAAPVSIGLSHDEVKRIWQAATWDTLDEQYRPISLIPRHVLSVARDHVPAHQHAEFIKATSDLIFMSELISTGLCTNPSCAIVRQLGRPIHSFALTDDLFRTAQFQGPQS